MKEVKFTLSDYSPADGESGVFGFLVYEVYYHDDSYGFFSTLKAANKRIFSLKKDFDVSYQITSHFVSFG